MKRLVRVGSLVTLLFLSSCTRFTHWAYHTFHEPESVKIDLMPAREHLCSVRAYYQMNTVAFFEALWLSDLVRSAYAELYAIKHAISEGQKELFLQQHLQENQYFITFYMLMAENETIAFKEHNGKWGIALEVDGVMYLPAKVKLLDEVTYEYRQIFGDRYTIFKKPYEVQFAAHTIGGLPVISPATEFITLFLTSTEYREYCTFWLEPPRTEVHHQHTY